MATEFNDSQHYGIFSTGTTLTSATGKYARLSELALSALRAQGVFDNMVDSTTAPAHDKLWLDKNTDPAVLKEWDSVGSSWVAMTFDRLFGRATVTDLINVAGTANAITCDEPSPFMDGKIYGIVPTLSNTGATTIQVAGVGTYDVVYPDGSAIAAGELSADLRTPLLFANGRFEVLFGSNAGSIKRAEVDASGFGFVLDEDDMASDSAEKVPTQQSVKAYVDDKVSGVSDIADRTALKTLTPANGDARYLIESGREGHFLFDSSDLSTEVGNDTEEGIYVAPASDATGASGAWVRQFDGRVNLTWFGAVGDGSTDCSDAWAGALATGLPIWIPKGHFVISTGATVSVANGDYINVVGAGSASTYLEGGSTGYILEADIGDSINRYGVGAGIEIKGLTLLASDAAGGGSGIYINLPDASAGPGSYDGLVRNFEDLVFVGSASGNYFGTCIKVLNGTYCRFKNIRGYGYNYQGTFIDLDGAKDGVGNAFSEVKGQDFNRGVYIHGRNEGTVIDDCQVFACNFPLDVDLDITGTETAQPLLFMMKTHLTTQGATDANPVCLHVDNVSGVFIDGSVIFPLGTNAVGISLENSGSSSQPNNTRGAITSTHINGGVETGTIGIKCSNYAQSLVIDETTIIAGMATGISLGSTTAAIDVSRVRLLSNTTDVSNSATGNVNRVNRDWRVLYQTSVAAAHTGDTTLTELATIALPARTLGANGRMRIRGQYTHSASANNKVAQIKINSLAILSETISSTTDTSFSFDVVVGNRNSNSSQITSSSRANGSNKAPLTTGANLAADATIHVYGQLSSATDTITLEQISVEVLYAP